MKIALPFHSQKLHTEVGEVASLFLLKSPNGSKIYQLFSNELCLLFWHVLTVGVMRCPVAGRFGGRWGYAGSSADRILCPPRWGSLGQLQVRKNTTNKLRGTGIDLWY